MRFGKGKREKGIGKQLHRPGNRSSCKKECCPLNKQWEVNGSQWENPKM